MIDVIGDPLKTGLPDVGVYARIVFDRSAVSRFDFLNVNPFHFLPDGIGVRRIGEMEFDIAVPVFHSDTVHVPKIFKLPFIRVDDAEIAGPVPCEIRNAHRVGPIQRRGREDVHEGEHHHRQDEDT